MNGYTKYALATFAGLLLLIILTRVGNPSDTFILPDQLARLATQAKQLYFLAKQDQNPLMSLVHLCMAVSKMDSLAHIATTDQIRIKYNVDFVKLANDCKVLQRELTREINQLAPKMALPDDLLL
jgi:hypothetical protein